MIYEIDYLYPEEDNEEMQAVFILENAPNKLVDYLKYVVDCLNQANSKYPPKPVKGLGQWQV